MLHRNSIWRTAAIVSVMMACIPASSGAQQPDINAGISWNLDGRLNRQLTTGVAPGAYLTATQSELDADTLRTSESYVQSWRPLRTFALVEGFNIIMTMFGQYVMDPEDGGFNVTWESVQQNLENGFEWDDNAFMTNNFRHPWMGALMFGAARANDYDFYQASLWAFTGSWLYEYTGEKHHPAYNDWINTSVGGMSFGESLYRLSNMVLDNTATGHERAWRELGGFVLQPLAGVNRMITGQAFDVYANPPDRFPDYFATQFQAGLRTYGEERVWEDEITKAYIEFDLSYGSMFDGKNEKPFDAFTFGIDITFDDQPRTISNMDIRGELGSIEVAKTGNTKHVLSAVQNFDYYDVDAYTFGGQSFSAAFNSRFWKDGVFEAQTALKLTGILLGASRSDYFNISGREYDYGPGLGYAFRAKFDHKSKYRLSMRHSGFWIHSVNGTEADHYASYSDVAFDVTLREYLGIGFKYILYLGENYYERHPNTSSRDPEIRLYLSWLAD